MVGALFGIRSARTATYRTLFSYTGSDLPVVPQCGIEFTVGECHLE